MNPNTDREILLALLRGEPVTGVTPEQWQAIAQLARPHQVVALLHRQLKTLGLLDQVPPDVLQTLRAAYLGTANRNLRIYRELSVLFEHLQQAGIEGILLKGAFLADVVYGNIAVRPMGDVDVLFKKADLARVDEIMLELGFAHAHYGTEIIDQSHHFGYKQVKSGLYVEVHWDLIDLIFGVHINMQTLWERSQPAQVANIPVRSLSPEDQVLHLCVHTSVHIFEIGLRAICDLAETLRHYQDAIDWEGLRQGARSWNAERCVYVNLRLAKELLNAPVPDDWLNAFQPADYEPRYLELACEHLFGRVEGANQALSISTQNVVKLWAADSLKTRWSVFFGGIFPSRQVMAHMYPASSNSPRILLYYFVRLKDLLQRYGSITWNLLRGDAKTVAQAEERNQSNALRSWLLSE